MAEPTSTTRLTPEEAARLAEFARACKGAARVVSLYPAGHPAIAASLARLAHITARLTDKGPCRLQVLPDAVTAGGAAMPKPDAAVTELADLLHRHLIGALTINAGADAQSWRTLLTLLARPPEDLRADGGIRHLWTTAGGPSIEIDEIDYAEVLREKEGTAAAIDRIVAAALAGRRLDLDDSGMRLLLDIVQDPATLEALMTRLEAPGAGQGASTAAAAFLSLLQGLTEWLAAHEPGRVDPVVGRMARAAGHLSADAMIALLGLRNRSDAGEAGSAARSVLARMDDSTVAHFVARSVVRERGASERLAHAFQALVPDVARQRQLLALAGQEVAATDTEGGDSFAELWARVEGMLTSYTDERYVSADYARELAGVRSRPIEVERTADDPPERIAAWLTTVNDAALRSLDHQLLLDLLHVERDPARWRDIAETAAGHVEDLVRVGYFDQAWQLADAIVVEGDADPARTPHASASLARFGRGTMMRHVATHLRGAADDAFDRFKALCHAAGPVVIPALAEAISSEQEARARRRLRDILIGFGARGSEAVRQLMDAPNWEVRRTAAYLLREFGGSSGLAALAPLLADSEPLVQREAVQGLVAHGSDEAGRVLLRAVTTGSGRTRETLLHELTAMRDPRAAPLFGYLARHLNPRRDERLYLSSLEALGTVGGAEAVEALTRALHQGDWRAPVQTRRLRAVAAHALRRIGTPAALDVLRDAAARGPRGVRAAARAELAQLG